MKLDLEIDSIIIGERFKGGVFRPCQEIIPCSTIEGALKYYFNLDLPAIGFFEENSYEFDEFVYSISDRFLSVSKMPIITDYLKPRRSNSRFEKDKIKANIYTPFENNLTLDNLKNSEFKLGALKSKGFGRTKIVKVSPLESEIIQGIFKGKIFDEECEKFKIEVISAIYGYLFKPDKSCIGGVYKKALFPGSIIKAPKILLSEETYYDE